MATPESCQSPVAGTHVYASEDCVFFEEVEREGNVKIVNVKLFTMHFYLVVQGLGEYVKWLGGDGFAKQEPLGCL